MFDDNTIAQLHANYQSQLPKKKPQKGKDFWTDQISTGGGIGGALAGGATGAAIGSVVPGVGTAIGGLAGAILGGALGSGGGELAENYITGEKDKFKNVGQEALLGGVTSLPFGAGLKVARAGVKLATGVGKTGARDLLEQAGQKVVGGQPTTTRTADFLQNAANKMYSQAFTVPRRVASNLKPEQTARELMNYGISGSHDAISNASTGVLGQLGKIVDEAANRVNGQIKVGDVTTVANNALKGVKITGPDRRALLERITNIGTTGSLPGYATPSQILDTVRDLESRGFSRINAGNSGLTKNPDLVDLGNAYVQVAKEMEDNLYKAVQSTGTLKTLQTKEVAAQLNGIAKGLGDKFLKAKDLGEVRSLMAPFVRARNLVSITQDEAQSAGSQGLGNLTSRAGGTGVGAVVGGLPGAAAGFLAAPLVRGAEETARAPIATTVARGLDTVAGKLPKAGGGQRALPLATRESVGRYATGNDIGSEPSLEEALTQSGYGEPSMLGDGFSTPVEQSPYSRESLEADIQRDPRNADKYLQLYDEYQKVYATAAPKLSATQQSAAARATNALNDIQTIQNAVESGGINKTLIPGSDTALGGNILGTTDIESALYNIGDVILRSRTGATAPPEEVRKFVAGFLPRGGESKEAQLSKLQRAYRELAGMINPPASGGSGLEDVLMQTYGG